MADIIELIYADHDWLRRQFFRLDDAKTPEELAAVWGPLGTRLDTHAEAEETVFYPALLKLGGKSEEGDPEDETEDAITDHNEIRDAVREAGRHEVGSDEWFAAVGKARTENGEHLDEEEREALPDFIKSATLDVRHELALKWLAFYAEHPAGRGIDGEDKDADEYIDQNS
ncbi:hemerythrin domain-containing protein [Jatrophihabitans fulvus]